MSQAQSKLYIHKIRHDIIASGQRIVENLLGYQDMGDVLVARAPTLPQAVDLVYELLKELRRNVSFQELVEIFRGVIGEDRLRAVILHLLAEHKIIEFPDNTIGVPEAIFTPVQKIKRRRKRVPRLIKY